MKYDDGFVAYLNGQRIASANAPQSPGIRVNRDGATRRFRRGPVRRLPDKRLFEPAAPGHECTGDPFTQRRGR